ncbi:MAG: hypothetical protein R2856_04910 [Caldilineaceae bacterium]
MIALFSAPGVPMLWMGQEYGEDLPRTIDFLPLKWDKLNDEVYRAHFEAVQRLILARLQHVAAYAVTTLNSWSTILFQHRWCASAGGRPVATIR